VNRLEIVRVEKYLREKFSNDTISIDATGRNDDSAEVSLGKEFIGVLYKDEDEGEVSYAFHMAVIDKDLPDS
jgi:hypothetical protein